MGKMFIILIRN